MDLYHWLLALHVLSAAALVAALVLFTVLIMSSRGEDVPSRVARFYGVARFGNIVVGVGIMGTLILGIWLAIMVDEYHVWDGWVIAAIVLWAIASEAGRRSGKTYTEAGDLARARVAEGNDQAEPELRRLMGDSRAFALHWVTVVLTLLILVDMIYKPGA